VPKEVKLTNQKVVPENTDSFEVGQFQVFNMLTDKPVENEVSIAEIKINWKSCKKCNLMLIYM
jgi:hypothetical protein